MNSSGVSNKVWSSLGMKIKKISYLPSYLLLHYHIVILSLHLFGEKLYFGRYWSDICS